MNKIQSCKMWLRAHEDLFIDLVRIYLGCGLVVKKGTSVFEIRVYGFDLDKAKPVAKTLATEAAAKF